MIPGKPKTIKRNNRKVILNLLRRSEVLTVADISREIGLSKTTVMKILDFYVKQDVVNTAGKGLSTDEGGKKPELFQFNSRYGYVLAVQIFPREVFIGITDLSCKLLKAESIRNNPDESVETIVSQISKLSGKLIQDLNISPERIIGAAVGTHGITNFDQGIICTSPHFPSWGENVPIKSLLERSLPFHVPLYIDNQIRFQVLAEKVLGLGKEKKNIIVLEGGEGLVAGIMVKNEIKRGVHYLAGEIGHMIINPEDSFTCSCGGKGCFEVMVSTRRLLEKAFALKKKYSDSMIFSGKSEEEITVNDIFISANSGDALGRILMDEIIRWFTIGISNIILMYDPEIIIIQGVYAEAGEYFLENLKQGVNTCSLVKIKKNVEVQYSNLGKDRGILGGAAFVIYEYFNRNNLYET